MGGNGKQREKSFERKKKHIWKKNEEEDLSINEKQEKCNEMGLKENQKTKE